MVERDPQGAITLLAYLLLLMRCSYRPGWWVAVRWCSVGRPHVIAVVPHVIVLVPHVTVLVLTLLLLSLLLLLLLPRPSGELVYELLQGGQLLVLHQTVVLSR